MMQNKWKQRHEFNGVHLLNTTQCTIRHGDLAGCKAKPGERVRVYFVNAGPNEFSSFHPIAGIWDRVYASGNPKNRKCKACKALWLDLATPQHSI